MLDQQRQEIYKRIVAAIDEEEREKLRGGSFLKLQSRKYSKRPGVIRRLTQGMASYPITWWGANIQLMAYSGAFGEEQKRYAKLRQGIFTSLIYAAYKHPVRTARVVYAFQKKVIGEDKRHLAQVAGRIFGGVLTTRYALQVGRPFKNNKLARHGSRVSQLLYVSYGAAIMAINQGVRELENVVWAILSGEYNFSRRMIFEEVKNLNVPDDEVLRIYEPYEKIIKGLQETRTWKPFDG